MSILTDLLKGKITFGQAASEAEQWASHIVSADPTLATAAGAILSDVKQAASNAVSMADGAVGAAVGPLAATIETGLDAALATVTKGESIPFNGFVNDGIDQMAAAIKAEADAWSLKAKAALATPAAPAS
jgi:hypothetical protein